MERRLAAILAADVVGYSRLVGGDEEDTILAMRDLHAAVLPIIGEQRGRVIDTAGDSVLAEFPSVAAAVRCALAIQEEVPTLNAGRPPERRLDLRIGIHQGDIVLDGGRAYGDGINVASRLQQLARPGGVAVSGRVHEDVGGKPGIKWRDGGERNLKNIAHPIRVWHSVEAGGVEGADHPAVPDRPSIGVLPFDNLSGHADDTVFSDGITEDIITGLARFRSLFVIARNSSFAFRGKSVTLGEIGRQLGVSYLLEGSVRRSGDRTRITAQLIEAATGAQVWADRYDRDIGDIFAIQDDVGSRIVATLFGRIESSKFQHSLRKPPENLEAYDFLLRGLARFRGYGDDDNIEACKLFTKAIEADPRYALAHAYLAFATVAQNGYATSPPHILEAAINQTQHAVELEPQEGTCHRLLGHVHLYARHHDLAEYHVRRSIELNPNDADGTLALGLVLALRGRPLDGLQWMETAVRLNPFHPAWYQFAFSIALYSLRRFDEAAQALRRMPNPRAWAKARLAASLAQLGRLEELKPVVADVLHERPDFSTEDYLRRDVLLEREEDRGLLREGLLKAQLPA